MNFEWDEAKRLDNTQKHGIDFVDIPEVFALPTLTMLDERTEYGEDRWIGIGFLRFRAVVVVYTCPDEQTIRIISARRALNHEERQYQEYIKNRLGPS